MRLFCRPLPGSGEQTLPTDVAHHARVLRVRAGDRVRLFDGEGHECDAEVLDVQRGLCRLLTIESAPMRARRLTLVIAIPKGKKLDTIVRMVTELGVHAVHLAISERTIARPDAERGEHKIDRLQRIAEEAAAQSQQSHVPTIHPPRALLAIATDAPADAWKIVPWEESTRPLDQACFATSDDVADDAWLVIGPEGGLAASEIAALERLGFMHATLGPTVLRVDTAAVIAIGLVLDRLGALGVAPKPEPR